MALQTLSAKRFQTKLKATIQSSGRLSFTEKTSKELQFANGFHVKFLFDNESKELFMAKVGGEDEDAFEVRTSGSYFYVATKRLFDELEYDYRKKNIMFDLVRKPALDEEVGGEVYKMNKRTLPRREKEDADDAE
jgi:hypothetical protein